MTAKTTKARTTALRATAYFVGANRRPVPSEQIRPILGEWKAGQEVRSILVEADSGGASASIWLEHRKHAGLIFRVELDRSGTVVSFAIRPAAFTIEYGTDGVQIPGSLEIDTTSVPSDGPRLTATALRSISFDQLRSAATAGLGRLLRITSSAPLPEVKRSRRSSLTDLDLARFCARWVALVRDGNRNPAQLLTEQYHLSYDGVIYRKRAAVERGLMTKTSAGLTGGVLTLKAEQMLAESIVTENGE
jgi:hypothetical protein